MQSGTQGDVVTLTLYQPDGTTPYSPSGYSNMFVVITNSLGQEYTVPQSAITFQSSNVLQWATISSMFRIGGAYSAQAIFNFSSGNVTKSRVVQFTISPSLK